MVFVEEESWYPGPERIKARIVGSKATTDSLPMNNINKKKKKKKKRMRMDSPEIGALGWGLVDGCVLSQSWRFFFVVVVVAVVVVVVVVVFSSRREVRYRWGVKSQSREGMLSMEKGT